MGNSTTLFRDTLTASVVSVVVFRVQGRGKPSYQDYLVMRRVVFDALGTR